MKRCLGCMEEYQEKEAICPHCGWTEDNFDTPKGILEPGNILKGRYIVGTVRRQDELDILYIGWDALFSRKVLIMEYFPEAMVRRREDGTIKAEDSFEEEFFRELQRFMAYNRKLITLDRTPGLLNVFAVTEDYGTAYVIMEFPEGKTLREMVYSYPDMCSPERVQWVIQDLSRPLSAAHRLGIYHGQVDMDHIYMIPHGSCFLGCFSGNVKESQDPIDRDIKELANLAGSLLAGERIWEERSLEENMNDLQDKVPSCIMDALRAVLGTSNVGKLCSVNRFADLFLDEATIEMV